VKKTALFGLLLIVCLCSAGAPEAAAPSDDYSVAVFEATFGETSMIAPIPHCGDYCENPGQSRGCIDDSGSVWRKVTCTCVGTTWICD